MRALADLSTRAKLMVGFGLIVVAMVLSSYSSWNGLARQRALQQRLYNDDLAVTMKVLELRSAINRERVALLSTLVAGSVTQVGFGRQLEAEEAAIRGLLGELAEHKNADQSFAADYARLANAYQEYDNVRDNEVLAQVRAGQRAAAGEAATGRLQNTFDRLRTVADEIATKQMAEARSRMRDGEALVETAGATLIVLNLAVVALAFAKTVWLNRAIAVPLRDATAVASRIATGDLRADVPAGTSRDEVGQLMRALGDMVQSWRVLAAETTRGVATLTGAAGEILTSSAQAAASTAETAAAVSETTATVEEVKQTSLLASEKSRTVSEAAQRAARTAADGRRALEDSVKGMGSIQEKMEAIASTVVRLSERSHAIGEITATVAGLAEQSNLLAVNAAIEAAKAGEHGRGFAVVAQEVKSLAEQSRQATRQVREILGEIQKSVGAAVMITEQGARTVAQGVEQTNQAGEAIRELADTMTEAAQAAVQIAVSSQQQLAGMDQVVLAMENIQQASTENAAGSRQAEASARNLHALGQSLRQTIDRFQF
ncbi:methyl-accepting chemotaxis protein [Telluria mixta]|uniref:Methyl-accepting chemotaxis protein n=1 Tax=Telluria mixta TaxID=34071 RepID=A0ABT2BZ51_9BURK|nr:methyl-accepting chemotaxis protein [Telluria mixta]MCS0630401.1 methyl-accepting chemotaxis protein [Telluria mixta]WEM94295.1 methyl-accepting chemotaxis protein [Telluria mixta]